VSALLIGKNKTTRQAQWAFVRWQLRQIVTSTKFILVLFVLGVGLAEYVVRSP
jgi:hypothetical protein